MALAALAPCVILYVLARMIGALAVEFLAVWAGLIVLLYVQAGARVLRRLWFPLLYLLFLMPPPFFLMAPATRALKLGIASGAVDLLAAAGLEVAVSGSTLFIDQYELLVEAACSGMNSLVGCSRSGCSTCTCATAATGATRCC